jgi:hypothetical protein
MSISEMPVPPSAPPMEAEGAPAPQEDEALVGVILEVVVSGLPELLKQDPAFREAMRAALGVADAEASPEEGDDDLDALLDMGDGDDEESIDALLEGFEGVGGGEDFAALG